MKALPPWLMYPSPSSLKPCKALCIMMVYWSLLFMIDMHTFYINSTRLIPLYSPSLLGMSTIVIHSNASRMCTYQNAHLAILTSLYHCSLSESFPLVALLIHDFKCSSIIPYGPLACPVSILRIATVTSYPYGGLSVILTGCTIMGVSSPSCGRHM